MNNEIEALYGRIGQAVSDLVGGDFRKAYVRVEMADDYGSLGLFYDPGTGAFHYLANDDGTLFDLFAELRRQSTAAGMGAWSQATFTIDGAGTFAIDLGFDDISDLGRGAERRQQWIAQHLGADARVVWPPSA